MTALNNADSSSQDSVVILLVVGEGGGYTILGEVHQGVWRFWLKAGGGDSWLYDEVDEPDSLKSPPEQATPSPKPKIEYKSSIDDALGLLTVMIRVSSTPDHERHCEGVQSRRD